MTLYVKYHIRETAFFNGEEGATIGKGEGWLINFVTLNQCKVHREDPSTGHTVFETVHAKNIYETEWRAHD